MKLIIDIDEERYKNIKEEQWLPNRLVIEKAIANGIPLEQIRDEIEHWESDDTQDDYQIGAMDMQKYVLRVIDKYTKEQTDTFSDYPDMPGQFDNMTGSMNLR